MHKALGFDQKCHLFSDTEPPEIECPADIVIDTILGEDFAVVMWRAPNVTDNSGERLTANVTPVSGTQFVIGSHIVFVDATDSSSNTANCSFTVTVEGRFQTTKGSLNIQSKCVPFVKRFKPK